MSSSSPQLVALPVRAPWHDRLPRLAPAVELVAVLLAFMLPLSVAGVNAAGGLLTLLVLLSREWWRALPGLRREPLAWLSVLLFALLAFAMLYSVGPEVEAQKILSRYRKLLFIPLLLPFFASWPSQSRVLTALMLATVFSVLCSWSDFIGLSHIGDRVYHRLPGDAVFQFHITQSYLFVVTVALLLARLLSPAQRRMRVLLGLALVLTLGDILFVMEARTGKFTLGLLALWFCWECVRRLRWRASQRRLLLALSVAGVALVMALVLRNPHSSLGTIATEIRETERTGAVTSQGQRLEFYRKALTLIAQRPLLGYGTGSVITMTGALADTEASEVGRRATFNLHNEFLMWMVQCGLPGLVALLAWCWVLVRQAMRLGGEAGLALRGTLVVFLSGCLYNSYLLDFAEGYVLVLLAGVLIPLRPQRASLRAV